MSQQTHIRMSSHSPVNSIIRDQQVSLQKKKNTVEAMETRLSHNFPHIIPLHPSSVWNLDNITAISRYFDFDGWFTHIYQSTGRPRWNLSINLASIFWRQEWLKSRYSPSRKKALCVSISLVIIKWAGSFGTLSVKPNAFSRQNFSTNPKLPINFSIINRCVLG